MTLVACSNNDNLRRHSVDLGLKNGYMSKVPPV